MSWFQLVWHWLEIHTGIARGGPDPFYNFWSGFGSDIGEVAIIGGIWMGIKKINCHVQRCPRIGHYVVDGTPYKVCRKHHPDVPSKGALTADHISDAHANAKGVC